MRHPPPQEVSRWAGDAPQYLGGAHFPQPPPTLTTKTKPVVVWWELRKVVSEDAYCLNDTPLGRDFLPPFDGAQRGPSDTKVSILHAKGG